MTETTDMSQNETQVPAPPTLPPLEERPLVTFALFAYNQEDYIREAVEGAFSQTYEPLEIILSDDCSTDRTFEIMQEMAAAYEGPHEVRVRRNEVNLGVVQHVYLRCTEARGEIIIVAAGDDISLPERAVHHVPLYLDPYVYGVSTSFELIDAHGRTLDKWRRAPISETKKKSSPYFKHCNGEYTVIQGSTASYRKKLFSQFDVPQGRPLFSEDNLLNFCIYASGNRVAFLDMPLVRYRSHPNALSNKPSKSLSSCEKEEVLVRSAIKAIDKLTIFRKLAETYQSNNVNYDAIDMDIHRLEIIVMWGGMSYSDRLISIFNDIKVLRLSMLRWKLPRLLGQFPRYQPKHIIELIKLGLFWK